jgi:RimJ/RimL family protein N-acetyltransferase
VPAIRLEPLSNAHLEGLEVIVNDPEVQRFTRLPSPCPPGFAKTWVGVYDVGRSEGTKEAFALIEDNGTFVGAAVAPRIDRAARTAELGYTVSPDARGRGVATEALRLLTDWAFDELGALRLELLIGVENEASKRVAARCGYVREGVLRSFYVKPGVREDTEIWSRLPDDA